MIKLLLVFALGALLGLAAPRLWGALADLLDMPPLPAPAPIVEETPPAPLPRPRIVTYCPWCVRPYQLADPQFVPRGIPQVCHIHGTGSLRVMTREQAEQAMAEQREQLGAEGGPFELDELTPWPRSARFVNGAN